MVDEHALLLPDGSPAPEVALEEMNQVHAEELARVRQLLQVLEDNRPAQEQARAWLEHTRFHFDNEKGLMAEAGFPPLPIHVAEHDQIWLQMEQQVGDYCQHQQGSKLAGWIRQVWVPWFVQHVNSMDRVTAQFVQQQRVQRK